jgi:hypothetical protein
MLELGNDIKELIEAKKKKEKLKRKTCLPSGRQLLA